MANYSSSSSASGPQLKPQTPVNGMPAHTSPSPAPHSVRTSSSGAAERPGSPVRTTAPPAPVLAPSTISSNGTSKERALGVKMHSSGLPASPSLMLLREGGSSSARGSNSELHRSAAGAPSDAGPDLGQAVYSSYGSPHYSSSKGPGGGADDGIYGSQRQTTRRTNDSVDKDPNGFEAGLRASGERFALIFSQLDELSLNSRLGRPDAAKSSASSETTAPSTGAGASESMSSSSTADREGLLSSQGAAQSEAASAGQTAAGHPSPSLQAFPTPAANASEDATGADTPMVEKLQRDLMATQRSQQEAVSRATVLASQTASLQEQLARAEEREKELQEKIRERDMKLAASADKLQAMDEVKNDSVSKERELEHMTSRLREAERTLSKVVASRQSGSGSEVAQPGSPAVGSAPSTAAGTAAGQDGHGPVVEELMRRLRLRERELNEANGKIEMLMVDRRRGSDSAERKRHSLDPASMSLGAVAREDSSMSVGSLSTSGMSGAMSTASTQDSEIEIKKLKERMKIVEEALRAMRDEAREHVLAIKSQDIVLNRLLGSGSFAEVHQATWHLPCAVKRLKDTVRHNKYEVQKFQREAYLLRSLLHPGVLRVFGFCKVDHLLVTEVVTGGSLHSIIHNCSASSSTPTGGPKKLMAHREVSVACAAVCRVHACAHGVVRVRVRTPREAAHVHAVKAGQVTGGGPVRCSSTRRRLQTYCATCTCATSCTATSSQRICWWIRVACSSLPTSALRARRRAFISRSRSTLPEPPPDPHPWVTPHPPPSPCLSVSLCHCRRCLSAPRFRG